ncbi:MAG: hypothetical protein QXP60_05615, partial [Nitrososphaerota archaeon]
RVTDNPIEGRTIDVKPLTLSDLTYPMMESPYCRFEKYSSTFTISYPGYPTLVYNWRNLTITSTGTVPDSITIISPNGGETWQAGSIKTVIWSTSGNIGNVNIDLSTNDGSSWTNLVSDTANDGSQTVTVPNTPSTTCRIRISERDGSPSDMSDNNWTISSGVQPTITVLSPNGGET